MFLITVLAASATALGGSALPSLDDDDSERTLLAGQDADLDGPYVSPLRAQRRSLLPDYPPGVEPGLAALMMMDGARRAAGSFSTASVFEPRRLLHADIASLKPDFGGDAATATRESRIAFASLDYDWGRDRFSIPIRHSGDYSRQDGYRQVDSLGLEWIRQLGNDRQIRLSAQQADSIHFGHLGRDTTNSVAQLAFTSDIAGPAGPRITGGVFLGSETPKDRDLGIGWSGRKYYGLSLESRFTAFQKHTPFASLQIARSDYEGSDLGGSTVYYPGVAAGYGYAGGSSGAVAGGSRRDDYSRLGAGWNWQIRPNWGLRAEAYYSLNNSSISAYEYDRSQFFFSSRYDFR